MGIRDTLVLDPKTLSRLTARRGLLRGELRAKLGLSAGTSASAFNRRPIGVKTARAIAGALNVSLAELLLDDVMDRR